VIDWLRREASEPVLDIAGRAVPVAIRRNARARRLTLRLASDGSEVRITLPRWCSTREAMAFAQTRIDWLADQLAKVPERRPPAAGGTL
jgi:predicted metal-dependent hydrolase